MPRPNCPPVRTMSPMQSSCDRLQITAPINAPPRSPLSAPTLASSHALVYVVGDDMAVFMREHGGDFLVRPGCGEQARIHRHPVAAIDMGVDLPVARADRAESQDRAAIRAPHALADPVRRRAYMADDARERGMLGRFVELPVPGNGARLQQAARLLLLGTGCGHARAVHAGTGGEEERQKGCRDGPRPRHRYASITTATRPIARRDSTAAIASLKPSSGKVNSTRGLRRPSSNQAKSRSMPARIRSSIS